MLSLQLLEPAATSRSQLRATEFDAPAAGGDAAAEAVDFNADLGGLNLVHLTQQLSERPDATVADVVVAGGRDESTGKTSSSSKTRR